MDALNLADIPGEYDTVAMALLAELDKCPYLPSGVKLLYNRNTDSECIVLRTMGGSYRPNVVGGYEARLSFQIGYRSYPNSNKQSIKAQEITDSIMHWLKESDKPLLTGGREITKLDISDCIPIGSTENDKATTYVASGVLHYEK